jgi:hypothetical protein
LVVIVEEDRDAGQAAVHEVVVGAGVFNAQGSRCGQEPYEKQEKIAKTKI